MASRPVTIGWTHPGTDEEFRVDVRYYPGHPGTGPSLSDPGSPPEGPEVDILSVKEDRPGGQNRPDLIPLVEADLASLTRQVEEALDARAEVAADLAFDAAREDRMFGRGR